MTAQAAFAATLVDEWSRAGLRHAFLSPGSRSTPMALALARRSEIHVEVVLDERSASFSALGVAQVTGQPSVVLTTSGTAAAELHPAVIEAHHASVPLLVVTADRPPELHHVGAPQTIEQEHLFTGALRWSCSPGVADARAASTWRSLASRAVVEAVGDGRRPGPVHLNVAFVDPLDDDGTAEAEAGRSDGRPWHQVLARPDADVRRLLEVVSRSRRGVIVAGAGSPDPTLVRELARHLGWPVLADPRSGCRTDAPTTVAFADAILRHEGFAGAHRPDIVLRLGAPWTSKVLGGWLASLDAEHVVVDPWMAWSDPDRLASLVVAAPPEVVCAALKTTPARPDATWLDAWTAAEGAARRGIASVVDGGDLTEPAIARTVARALPHPSRLVVSSSMPIRDLEWYAEPRDGLTVHANRGANGIDGVVSTALGVALASPEPVACLVGDLALVHDIGALARLREAQLTVVVVDNDGGGIFGFLPQARSLDSATFERLFGTPHGLDLAAVARGFGVEVAEPPTADELHRIVAEPADRGRVVVVRTDRASNVEVHEAIHSAVRAAVDATT